MKKYLIGLLLLLCPFLFAGSIQQQHMAVLGQYNAAGAVTWEHILSLEDNAASTTVVNTGTVGDSWTATFNTEDRDDPVNYIEGLSSFYMATTNDAIQSPANWTDENTEVRFCWMHDINATSATNLVQFGDGDNAGEAGEILIQMMDNGATLTLRVRGYSDAETDNLVNETLADSASTWRCYRVTFDATQAGLALTAGYNLDNSDTFTPFTFAGWDAGAPAAFEINQLIEVGGSNTGYDLAGNVDHVRIRKR